MTAARAEPGPAPGRKRPPWERDGRSFWLILGGIVLAAVIVRVLYTLLVAPWPPKALDDQFYFSGLPRLLADGKGFISPFQSILKGVSVPTAEHPPFYSVVLAGFAKVGLGSSDAQRLTGSLFGAGTLVTVGVLTRRLAGNRAALIAVAIGAVYPVLIAADGALMSESLFGLLVALTLLAADRLRERPSLGRAVALGAVAGLAAQTRGEALFLLPLVLVPTVRLPGGVKACAATLVACLVVLAPWTIRSWIVFNRPVIIATNSGTATGGANCRVTFYGDHLGGWWPPCLHDHPGNEAQNHNGQFKDGVHYAEHHAGRLPVVFAARLGRVWSVYDPFQTPEGRSVRLQKLGVPVFFVLLLLGIAGVRVLRRRRTGVWILLMPFVVVSLTAVLTYGNARFREPADVVLVILAAIGVDALWRARDARRTEAAP